MEKGDIELIQRVLSGDENAFSALVKKYQKAFTRLHGGKSEISISLRKSHKMLSYRRTKNLPP